MKDNKERRRIKADIVTGDHDQVHILKCLILFTRELNRP